MKGINGKTAFITGAGSGIGAATAMHLAKLGARVICTDVNSEAVRGIHEGIVEAGGASHCYDLDVSDFKAIVEVIDKITGELGPIQLAFNNAGIGGVGGPFHEMSIENWNQVIDINLTGLMVCMREELKSMMANGGGNIVNVASLAGLNGMPYGAHYCATKHAVIGLTKTAALEYGKHNIRVNSICPGFIDTPILEGVPDTILNYSTQVRVPMKRIGTPDEVAHTVAWLMSDEASYINAHSMQIDGGFMAG